MFASVVLGGNSYQTIFYFNSQLTFFYKVLNCVANASFSQPNLLHSQVAVLTEPVPRFNRLLCYSLYCVV